MNEIEKFIDEGKSSRVSESNPNQQDEQITQVVVPKGKRTTLRKKRKIEKVSPLLTNADQIDGTQNKRSIPDVQPSSEIIPESPVADEESSMKKVAEDVPTLITKEDLGTEKQTMDDVAPDAVTSATAEAFKKDDSRDIPTSEAEGTITTKTQSIEKDSKVSSGENNQRSEPENQD
ncbi:hypothetical protein A2U01_0021408, partial [Trifolium medium]|nr:hypothetical protein [Trifolium medium]